VNDDRTLWEALLADGRFLLSLTGFVLVLNDSRFGRFPDPGTR